jgi:SAM-dependent methyltransferase
MKQKVIDVHVPWANFRSDQFIYIPCPMCGSFAYETKATLVINWIEFFIVQCPTCKVSWRNPLPDNTFLTDLYEEEYFEIRKYPQELRNQVGIPDTDEIDQNKRREKTRSEVQDWIDRGILPYDQNGISRKFLEIGGGRGYLQRAAAEEGWDTIGLEISPHGIKEAINRGLMVLPIILDELCNKYVPYLKFFDVVVFFDFLEHVTDPSRILRMVHTVLKDDGYIILRIPCISDDECPMYHLVDHIWHFSEVTIKTLLQREGFVVSEHSHPSGRFPTTEGQVKNMTFFAKKK